MRSRLTFANLSWRNNKRIAAREAHQSRMNRGPQEGNRNLFKPQTHFHCLFTGFPRLIESCASAIEQRQAGEPFVKRNNKRNWRFHENFFSSQCFVRPASLRKKAPLRNSFSRSLSILLSSVEQTGETQMGGKKVTGKVKQNVIAMNCLRSG